MYMNANFKLENHIPVACLANDPRFGLNISNILTPIGFENIIIATDYRSSENAIASLDSQLQYLIFLGYFKFAAGYDPEAAGLQTLITMKNPKNYTIGPHTFASLNKPITHITHAGKLYKILADLIRQKTIA